MLLRFATKRSSNGLRKYLNIDTENKLFSTDNLHWLCRGDFSEVTKKDRDFMIIQCEENNYIRVDRL